MKVEDLMTRTVRTCGAENTLEHAARLMWEGDLGCLPVVDEEGRPIGMITDRDICMAAYTQGAPLRDLRVAGAMNRQPIVCSPRSSIADVEALMQRWQIRRVPVVDLGALVGIVTLGDIARYSQSSPLHVPSTPGLAKTLAAVTTEREHPKVAAE
jgi:CBS domain-containing protein